MAAAEPEALPWPLVRRGSEAAVEKAGAAIDTGGEVVQMIEPVKTSLPVRRRHQTTMSAPPAKANLAKRKAKVLKFIRYALFRNPEAREP